MNRIIVATKNPFTAKRIENKLNLDEVKVISLAFDSDQLLEDINTYKPDLCLIDSCLNLLIKDYNSILSKYKLPILLIEDEVFNLQINHPLLNVIKLEHCNTPYLHNLMNYMIKASKYINAIELKQYNLQKELYSIKLIRKAKQLLMRYEGFSEVEAHKFIINKSMQKRITKEEASENVIKRYKPFS